MKSVRIESASEALFKQQYPELVAHLENSAVPYEFRRDAVGFGDVEQFLVAGLVFVYESLSAGLTYDLVKERIRVVLATLSPTQQEHVHVEVEVSETGERYDISFDANGKNVDLELPGKLRLRLRE